MTPPPTLTPAASPHLVNPPPLGHRTVQIWAASPTQFTSTHRLSATEQARLARFARPHDRATFVTAANLLRLLAGHHLGVPAADVPVTRICPTCPHAHGKPRMPGTGLEVSIAHTCGKVLLALTRVAQVGVDIEHLDPNLTPDQLPTKVLNPAERLPTEPADRTRAFLRYWTRKESVVKASGIGLRSPLPDVIVTPHDLPARILRFQHTFLPPINIHDLEMGADYLAAVSVLTPGPVEVTIHHLAPGQRLLHTPLTARKEPQCA